MCVCARTSGCRGCAPCTGLALCNAVPDTQVDKHATSGCRGCAPCTGLALCNAVPETQRLTNMLRSQQLQNIRDCSPVCSAPIQLPKKDLGCGHLLFVSFQWCEVETGAQFGTLGGVNPLLVWPGCCLCPTFLFVFLQTMKCENNTHEHKETP